MLCPTFHQLLQIGHTRTHSVSPVDLIRIVCSRCDSVEVCPAIGDQEYNARHKGPSGDSAPKEVRDVKD